MASDPVGLETPSVSLSYPLNSSSYPQIDEWGAYTLGGTAAIGALILAPEIPALIRGLGLARNIKAIDDITNQPSIGAQCPIENITNSRSINNFKINETPSSFTKNLENNGYRISSGKDGARIYSKGSKTYTLYKGTSTQGLSVDVQISGKTIVKYRFD